MRALTRRDRTWLAAVLTFSSAGPACADYGSYKTGQTENRPVNADSGWSSKDADGQSSRADASQDGRSPSPSASDGTDGSSRRDASVDAISEPSEPLDATFSQSEAGRDAFVDATSEQSAPVDVTFSQSEDIYLFDYVLASPNSGPANWAWFFSDDPHLVELNDVLAGSSFFPLGPSAIYRGRALTDGFVSVRAWGSDTGHEGILLRYQDMTHFYAFIVTSVNWTIDLADGTLWKTLACGGLCGDSGLYTHDHGTGHTLKFEAIGNRFTASINGTELATVIDPDNTYATGSVGLYTRQISNIHFDDFHVEGSP